MIAAAGCFLLAFAFYVRGAAPTVSFEDTGELITAAWCLGISHPPGVTWHTLLGRLFQQLPVGDLAFRTTLLSCASAAGAVTAAAGIARALGGPVAGWTAAVALAGTPTLWWQASIADKYALSACLLALAAGALARAWSTQDARRLSPAWFLAGVALSHHPQGLFLVPAAVLASIRLGPTPRRAAIWLLCLALPVLARVTAIPLLAARNPWLNWGAPDHAGRLLDYLLASQYRSYMLNGAAGERLGGRMLHQFAGIPWAELGPVLLLSLAGAFALRRRPAGLAAGMWLLLGAIGVFNQLYARPLNEPYYLLATALFAMLAGLGASALIRGSRWWALACGLALLPPVWSGGHPARDGHTLPWDLAWNEAAPLPHGALIGCSEDDQTNTLVYLHAVCGVRPDVRVLPVQAVCGVATHGRFARHLPDVVFPPLGPVGPRGMHDFAGNYYPRLAAANPGRRLFVTADLLPLLPQDRIAPFGTGFEVFGDAATAAQHQRAIRPLPRLRLRGWADARQWDLRSFRAGIDLGGAYTVEGMRYLAQRNSREAARALRIACRLPLSPEALAAARTALVRARRSE